MKSLKLIALSLLLPGMLWSQGMQVKNTFRANTGAFIRMNGNLKVDSGNLILNAGTSLVMGDDTLSVNGGGNFKAIGNNTNQAIITSTGCFIFIINAGGSISARHATFEKMNGNGLTIEDGAIIDPNNPLSHCILVRYNCNSNSLLTINNQQHLTIDSADFISDEEPQSYNVSKTLNQGIVNFINYTGGFSGEFFEEDPFRRIFWDATALFDQLVDSIIAGEDDSLCFDALGVITLEELQVQNGGMVELVAGQSILLLPGVRVEDGGYLRAWISIDGIFCPPQSMLASDEIADEEVQKDEMLPKNETLINIYPNPTTGRLVAEITGSVENEVVSVQIFGMLGELIQSAELKGAGQYIFDLSNKQSGIYLVRAIKASIAQTIRIVKQ